MIPHNLLVGDWRQHDRVLQQSVEQQAGRTRRASIKAKSVFIKVIVKIKEACSVSESVASHVVTLSSYDKLGEK